VATTLFRDTTYTLAALVEAIKRGDIALPDIQRPFVWSTTKVRDLFDSMFKGFPVGYLLFWATDASPGARQIGGENGQAVARLLIVDGQQRLTSLFAVLTGTAVVDKDFRRERIRIAFRPTDCRFEVTDAAIEKDPEFIPDITDVFLSHLPTRRRYLQRLREHQGDIDPVEQDRLEENIARLYELASYPFKVVELEGRTDEEQVAEVFVRINSEGVPLNQADFILTLMSIWWEAGRRNLEEFSRAAKQPLNGRPSPFNHFIQPGPDQMLRSAIGLAFRRGRLRNVYTLLRGKDMDTGRTDHQRRDEQFALLQAAQARALDLTNWHDFLGCLTRAGFRSARMISSENAVLYSYLLWLIGKHDYGLDVSRLRDVIARWFFMAHTTGRYTTSPESQIEADLLRLRDLGPSDGEEFCTRLDREIETVFTNDYWRVSLPNRLNTSSATSPALVAYWSALNLLDAEVLFSRTRITTLLDPAVTSLRAVERHHLFPRRYLETIGVTQVNRVNQIANMTFIDWSSDPTMASRAPSAYWPVLSGQVSPAQLERHRYWHALPVGWEQLGYDEFLARRRDLIAAVIRAGFETLKADSPALASKRAAWTSTADLIQAGESMTVEFKSSARWSYKGGVTDAKLEQLIVKTVAGFMNSEGGVLVIGVDDAGKVVGLRPDYQTLGKGNRDGYELFLTELFTANLSGPAPTLARVSFHDLDGQDVCRLDVAASAQPVFARGDRSRSPDQFWVRMGNSTRQLTGPDMAEYQQVHWS
jgi:hypothetical protein